LGPRYVTETMLFLQFNHNFCFIASVDIVCFLSDYFDLKQIAVNKSLHII